MIKQQQINNVQGVSIMTKFQLNITYKNNFICNSDSWFYFKVLKRTEKSVWIQQMNADGTIRSCEKLLRKKIDIYNDIENCKPMGSYSMNPILSADRAA